VKTTHTQVRAVRAVPGATTGFTLIELLVVIVIIGILVAIVVGAVQSVVRDRKIAQAKSEVQAIATAAEEYYRIFREIPVSTNWYNPTAADASYTPTGSVAMADEFYNRLMGSNEQSKVFLDIKRMDIATTPTGNSSNGAILDPWKTPYAIYFDSNYDGVTYGFRKDCTVFIRSRGPNKLQDPDSPSRSDDISWPPMDTIW
jgi:prepilin-type N-terminal cleavage/methylation domain-containing protein